MRHPVQSSFRIASLLPLALLAPLLLAAPGCSEDEDGPPPRESRIIFVPGTAATIEEALSIALPGDSIKVELVAFEMFSATVTVEASQTPLYLGGTKTRPLIAAPPDGGPVIRFRNPKAGTAIENLSFSGGNAAIQVEGRGALDIRDCTFQDGVIHVLASGSGARVTAERCLMRDPGLFGIRAEAQARVESTRNTIVGAGDCGVLSTDGAEVLLRSSLIHRSANYGIACVSGGTVDEESGCNDIHLSGLSGQSHYLTCPPGEGDFHLDPLFCDESRGDFTLGELSPCAELNSGGCGVVGAFGAACTPEE